MRWFIQRGWDLNPGPIMTVTLANGPSGTQAAVPFPVPPNPRTGSKSLEVVNLPASIVSSYHLFKLSKPTSRERWDIYLNKNKNKGKTYGSGPVYPHSASKAYVVHLEVAPIIREGIARAVDSQGMHLVQTRKLIPARLGSGATLLSLAGEAMRHFSATR